MRGLIDELGCQDSNLEPSDPELRPTAPTYAITSCYKHTCAFHLLQVYYPISYHFAPFRIDYPVTETNDSQVSIGWHQVTNVPRETARRFVTTSVTRRTTRTDDR